MVLQDAWLYEGTIKENLRFGNLEATDEELWKLQRQPMSITLSGHSPGGYNMEMNQSLAYFSRAKVTLTIARAF